MERTKEKEKGNAKMKNAVLKLCTLGTGFMSAWCLLGAIEAETFGIRIACSLVAIAFATVARLVYEAYKRNEEE